MSAQARLTNTDWLLVGVFLVVAMVGTVGHWRFSMDGRTEQARRVFEYSVDLIQGAISGRLATYAGVLEGAAGFWRTAPAADDQAWAEYLGPLDIRHRYPGIDTLAFVALVPDAEGAGGDAPVEVAPDRSGIRDKFIISRIYPTDWAGMRGQGVDLGAEPRQRLAAELARDSGHPAMTPPLQGASGGGLPAGGDAEAELEPDFIVFVPVYARGVPNSTVAERRLGLRGWVAMGLRVRPLLDAVTGDLASVPIHMHVTDGGADRPVGLLLFAHDPDEGHDHPDPELSAIRTIVFAGQRWSLSAHATPAFEQTYVTVDNKYLVLGLDIALALALTAGLALLLVSRQQSALLAAQALAAVDRSERKFLTAFNASPYAQVISEVDSGRLLEVNAAFRQTTGYEAEEVIGRTGHPLGIWVEPEERQRFIAAIIGAAGGGVRDFEARLQRRDGDIRTCLISSERLQLDDTACLLSIVRDVTDQRTLEQRLREDERKYRTIVGTTAEGYWLIDIVTLTTVEVNESLCRMLCEPAEQLIGRSPLAYCEPEAAQRFERRLRALGCGGAAVIELALRRSDGRAVIARVGLSALHDDFGRAVSVFAFVTDITAERLHEREIERLKNRLQLILDGAGEGMVGLDRDARIVFVNATGAELLGRREEEMLGDCWGEVSDHRQADGTPCFGATDCPVLRACREGVPLRAVGHFFTSSDGRRFPVECVATALKEEDRVVGAVLVFQDITQRLEGQRAMAEREQLFRQMFEKNVAIKVLVDPVDGRILAANQAAADYYGYPLARLQEVCLQELTVGPPANVLAELGEAVAERRQLLRLRQRLASGAIRDVEVHTGPVSLAERTGVHGAERTGIHGAERTGVPCAERTGLYGIVTDVTDRNRFEEELEAKSAELERSNADLQQFAYAASHDLRQPLRIIVGYLTLLQDHLAGRLDGETKEFFGFVTDGARRMDALIVDLLNYSRVGRSGEAMEPVPMNGVLAAAAANLGIGLPGSDIAFSFDPGMPVVQGVRAELIRLFQNLIGNAIKYRHPDRGVEIRVTVQREGQEWILGVVDNGIGIKSEYFERIFQIFQRLHGRDKYEGTGIGLAIARRIVHRHGGRVWVASEFGIGSTFFVALPVLRREDQDSQEGAGVATRGSGGRYETSAA